MDLGKATVNTIRTIQKLCATRTDRWHKGKPRWSLLEWAGAMCGEAGESANFAKKVKRLEEGLQNITTRGATMAEAKEDCIKEAADAVLYAMCLANAAGIDLEDVIVDVFNQKSEEYGFPERLEKVVPF